MPLSQFYNYEIDIIEVKIAVLPSLHSSIKFPVCRVPKSIKSACHELILDHALVLFSWLSSSCGGWLIAVWTHGLLHLRLYSWVSRSDTGDAIIIVRRMDELHLSIPCTHTTTGRSYCFHKHQLHTVTQRLLWHQRENHSQKASNIQVLYLTQLWLRDSFEIWVRVWQLRPPC